MTKNENGCGMWMLKMTTRNVYWICSDVSEFKLNDVKTCNITFTIINATNIFNPKY